MWRAFAWRSFRNSIFVVQPMTVLPLFWPSDGYPDVGLYEDKTVRRFSTRLVTDYMDGSSLGGCNGLDPK